MNHVQVKTAAATMGEFFDLSLRIEFLSQGSPLRSTRDPQVVRELVVLELLLTPYGN